MPKKHVVKTVYYGNWADLWGFPLAAKILPLAVKIPFLTPNIVTVFSYLCYLIGSLLFFSDMKYAGIGSLVLLPLGFVLDDLDGQLAREKNMRSELGNYLDKVLDVLKIFTMTVCAAGALYLGGHGVVYVFLAFSACFLFNYRYYIKMETVLRRASLDKNYLDDSMKTMDKVEAEMDARHANLKKSTRGRVMSWWLLNRLFFIVDEAEIAIIAAVGAAFNRLDLAVIAIFIGQLYMTIWRVIERAHQISTNSERLYLFMRK